MRNEFLEWISRMYAGRRIKISGGPYLDHLLAVAEMAAPAIPLGYEIGLCHDLLEDTPVTAEQLIAALVSFGYGMQQATYITQVVTELSDHYTAETYPMLKKKKRKLKEDERRVTLSSDAQTVEYADLIYNIKWTKQYQPKKANAYLERKRELLIKLDKGDERLRQLALAMTSHL